MHPALFVRALVACGLAAAACTTACDEVTPPAGADVQRVVGRTGFGPREFSYPRAAAWDGSGHLYVVDKAARIQCFAAELEFVCEWRMPDWEAGKPTGLGIGPDGRVYVADTHYSRVVIFEPDGRLVGTLGSHGRGPGQLLLPTDVAIDADGFIYVAEYGGNDRISKFGPDLQYKSSFGSPGAGPGELQRPQSLVLDDAGMIWVADACNHRICRFTRDGKYIGSFGESGSGPGQLRFPYSVDRLSDGTLVVCEYGNNRLQRFDRVGHSLGTWGGPGRQTGQLAYPWAAAVGAADRTYVIDSGNNRVQVLDASADGAWR